MSTDERRGHIERLQTATQSRDLRMQHGRSDVDYVLAAGLVARRTGQCATQQLRTVASASELRRARSEVVTLARAICQARRWRLPEGAIAQVAEAALAHHVDPVCKHCHGQKFRLIPGTPVKSDRACQHCHGTGQHPIPRKHRDEIATVLSALREMDDRVEQGITALMR